MKIISPKIHVVLDYLVAIFLIIAPNLIDLSANAAIFSMVLGSVHFLLTIVTIIKGGVVKLVPFPVHGIIELIVSITLGILAFTLFSSHMVDHFYYASLAIAIFLVFILTNYKAPAK